MSSFANCWCTENRSKKNGTQLTSHMKTHFRLRSHFLRIFGCGKDALPSDHPQDLLLPPQRMQGQAPPRACVYLNGLSHQLFPKHHSIMLYFHKWTGHLWNLVAKRARMAMGTKPRITAEISGCVRVCNSNTKHPLQPNSLVVPPSKQDTSVEMMMMMIIIIIII